MLFLCSSLQTRIERADDPARLLRARDCTTELRWEQSRASVLVCSAWSTAAERWDLSFRWGGPPRALRGRSSCCSATIRARRCPAALLWSPVQIWWWDCRRSVGLRFFSAATEFFNQEESRHLERPVILLLHFPSTQRWQDFFPLFNPCLGNPCAKFCPIVMPFWHGQKPLASQRARQPWL